MCEWLGGPVGGCVGAGEAGRFGRTFVEDPGAAAWRRGTDIARLAHGGAAVCSVPGAGATSASADARTRARRTRDIRSLQVEVQTNYIYTYICIYMCTKYTNI